ncbi:hypothetical protein ABID30_002269 [Enterococcus rotai]|uniref:Uncharacterized protein n=1 Tax=Enterococcus rotai TaxID=118060 RepID=A0A0U2VLU0_9ENTE|nr:hypothetical protein ATZ35_15110 [Enterococcus rotai]
MGRTGIVEYKAFHKVAKMFVFTLYSAKTQRLDQCLNLSCFFGEYRVTFRGVFVRKVTFFASKKIGFYVQ